MECITGQSKSSANNTSKFGFYFFCSVIIMSTINYSLSTDFNNIIPNMCQFGNSLPSGFIARINGDDITLDFLTSVNSAVVDAAVASYQPQYLSIEPHI